MSFFPIKIPDDAIESPLRMFGVPAFLAGAIGEIVRAILGTSDYSSAVRAAERASAAVASRVASDATLDALMKSKSTGDPPGGKGA